MWICGILFGMNAIQLMNLAQQRIEQAYQDAEAKYQKTFSRPKVGFGIRGRVAGRAFYHQNRIELNFSFLLQEKENFISRTPGHEAAHLIAFQLYGGGIRPHGIEWKSVMRAIGQEPSRCHDFEVKTSHVYICKCKKHYLSTRRHNSFLTGQQKYICNNCRSYLQILKWNENVVQKENGSIQSFEVNSKTNSSALQAAQWQEKVST